MAFVTVLSWHLGIKTGQLPIDVYVADPDDQNLLQWTRDWTKANTSIVTASVIGDASDRLYLYLDYIYSGEHGDNATACGSIRGTDGNRVEWTCSPVGVVKGRGFVTLRMQLSSKVDQTVCSEEVGVRIYSDDRGTFFTAWYPYRKVWMRNGDDFEGKVRRIYKSC